MTIRVFTFRSLQGWNANEFLFLSHGCFVFLFLRPADRFFPRDTSWLAGRLAPAPATRVLHRLFWLILLVWMMTGNHTPARMPRLAPSQSGQPPTAAKNRWIFYYYFQQLLVVISVSFFFFFFNHTRWWPRKTDVEDFPLRYLPATASNSICARKKNQKKKLNFLVKEIIFGEGRWSGGRNRKHVMAWWMKRYKLQDISLLSSILLASQI